MRHAAGSASGKFWNAERHVALGYGLQKFPCGLRPPLEEIRRFRRVPRYGVDGEINGDAPQDRRHGFHGKPVTPPERGVDLAGGFLKSRHERGGVGKPFLGPSGEKKPRIPVPVQYVLRHRVHGFSL